MKNNNSEAITGLFQKNGGYIPLEGVEVQGDIVGRGAKVQMRQRFRNMEDNSIEVVYKFPLPESAAICGFKAIVDDRIIEGQIEEREKAFEIYDKALSDGHGAQLLDEERPNIFTLSVGNVKPKSVVVIEISYVMLLDTHGSEVRFYLPTTISPRYTPENQPDQNGIPVHDLVNPPFALHVPYGLKLNINVHNFKGIASVGSASHLINTEFTGDIAVVSFASEITDMDRDFILTVVYKQDFVNRGFLFRDRDASFIQVDFMPDADTSTGDQEDIDRNREIIFLLDCSGSMGGSSIAEAKKALEIMIKALNPGTLFNIYRFGSTFEHLFSRSMEYNEKRMTEALTYLSETDASLGGTAVLAPLKNIYLDKLKGSQCRDIVLITDGEVGNEDQVMDLVKRFADNTKLHTVGIGNGPNEFFIKGLARTSRGASELIAPHERIEPKVLRIFNKVINGSIRNIRIDWGVDVEQAPVNFAAFIGQGMSIFAHIKGGHAEYQSIKVTGETRSGLRTWDIELAPVSKEETPIPLLWAREKIRDIEEDSMQGSRQRERINKKSSRDIVEISKQYGIASSLTSFVGVEKRSEHDKSMGEIVLRKVPAMLTKEWGGLSDRRAAKVDMSSRYDMAMPSYIRVSQPEPASYCTADRCIDSSIMSRMAVSPIPYEDPNLDVPAYLRQGRSVSKGSDLLFDILSLQQAGGGFYIDRHVSEYLSLSDMKAIVENIHVSEECNMEKVLMSLIVLTILELKFEARRDEWEGVVEKSRRWLQYEMQRTSPTIDQQPLEQWVRDLLQGRKDVGDLRKSSDLKRRREEAVSL